MVEMKHIIPNPSFADQPYNPDTYQRPPTDLSISDQTMHAYGNPARAGFNVFVYCGVGAIAALRDNHAHTDTAEPLLGYPLQAGLAEAYSGMYDAYDDETSPFYWASYCFSPKKREAFVADAKEAATLKQKIYGEEAYIESPKMRWLQSFEEYIRVVTRKTFEESIAVPLYEKGLDLTPDIIIPEIGYRFTTPSYWDWHIGDRILLSDRLETLQSREVARVKRLEAAKNGTLVSPEAERAYHIFEWFIRQHRVLFEQYIKPSVEHRE
jgi:hypothetical protein